MGFTLLGILNAQASAISLEYFLSVLGGTSADIGNGIAIDSADNVYIAGQTSSAGAGGKDVLIAKYDTSVDVEFQNSLGGTLDDIALGIAIDSADNFYITGSSGGGNSKNLLLTKYNSSGTIQFQKLLGDSAIQEGNAIAIDSANNVYVVGKNQSGIASLLLTKYNSSGAIQFQKQLSGSSNDIAFGIAIDSANNVYVSGNTSSEGLGFSSLLFAKYNSSGTIQFQKTLSTSGLSSATGKSLAIDSADNVYIAGGFNSGGGSDSETLLVKFNSAGSIQFQKILNGTGFDEAQSLTIDSADNVYIAGRTTSAGAGSIDCIIAKYNSSGTIQFQRTLGGTSNEFFKSMAVDSADNIYMTGQTQSVGAGSVDVFTAKLPNDGSLTGTYSLDGVNITYQASTLSSQNSSLTVASSSLTDSTLTLTDSTSSLTSATTNLTVVTEGIG